MKELPREYWKVKVGDVQFRVSGETALGVQEWLVGGGSSVLVVSGVTGERIVLVQGKVDVVWESTEELRALDRAYDEMLEGEVPVVHKLPWE